MTTKQRRRLHITEITSVGLVDVGDNPNSEIVFWKSGDKPTQQPTQENKMTTQTVGEAIIKAVTNQAKLAQLKPGNLGKQLPILRSEIWGTAIGKELQEMTHGPISLEPWGSEAVTKRLDDQLEAQEALVWVSKHLDDI